MRPLRSTGQGGSRQFFSITVPQLKYTIITSSTLMLVGSLVYFDLILVLTQGGPGDATRILALDMYITGFQANQMGVASVIGVILGRRRARADPRHPAPRRPGPAGRARWRECEMTTTVATPVTAPPRVSSTRPRRVKGRRNYLGGLFGWVWLAIIIMPIYYIVITSFKDQGAYFTQNPLALPNPPTLTAYQQVVEAGIIRYFFNSVIVTVGAVIPLVLFSFLASYAIVRGESRLLRFSRTMFLLGLAIPLQATIIPIYLIIIRIHMYDTLRGADLAVDRLRDPAHRVDLEQLHPRRTARAVRVDATGRLHRLADGVAAGVPADQAGHRHGQHLQRPARMERLPLRPDLDPEPGEAGDAAGTVGVPGRVHRQHPSRASRRGAVSLPILVLYIVGRRQLLAGLTAGFGK